MPPVRLAPREELAAAARVAPLLRAARDLSRWADQHPEVSPRQVLDGTDARSAADALELTPDELDAAWQVVAAASEQAAAGDPLKSLDKPLPDCDDEELLREWDAALAALLAGEELDGLATALYTVGAPVKIDALFDAYSAAAGPDAAAGRKAGGVPDPSEAAALSHALETLADLGVVELGTEETAGGLTVALSPLGIWGVHRRLLAQGWHVPVMGGADRDGAVGLLVTLASCDAEDGESEINSWLVGRSEERAAAELIAAAAAGSPGLRGRGVRGTRPDRQRGRRRGPGRAGRTRCCAPTPRSGCTSTARRPSWVPQTGRGCWLISARACWRRPIRRDVVAELLPEVPPEAQAEIVAGLWQVSHPGVIDLLTTLSEHHPDPGVARAARKAAFKARSPGAGSR